MKEIQRVSVTDAVVENIKELIESGEYSVGDKLPTESTMCEMMHVSRTCVREAIRVLQAINLIDIRPGKGAFVADSNSRQTDSWYNVPDAQFYDFMEVRMAIETLSTRLAINRVTNKELKKLDEIHESFLEANKSKNLTKLVMFDELFHTEIVSMTGNKLLMAINKQLIEANKKYRCESFVNNKVYSNAITPHTKIVQCFHDKNAEQGQKEMYNHLKITKKDMDLLLLNKEQ